MRSGERRDLEANALAAAMRQQIDRWRSRGEWLKIQCAELLFVRGWANKEVAGKLNLTEQQVANQKFDFLARLRTLLEQQHLSPEVFPELQRKNDRGDAETQRNWPNDASHSHLVIASFYSFSASPRLCGSFPSCPSRAR